MNASGGVSNGQWATTWHPRFQLGYAVQAQNALVPLSRRRSVGDENVDVSTLLRFGTMAVSEVANQLLDSYAR